VLAEPGAITIERLSFKYPNGGVLALDGLDLSIGRGRSVGLVGPSGCGKSTLLSIVAELLKPTSGRVSVQRFDRKRQTLTMMFQKDTLLPWLTAVQNVKLFYRIHGGGHRADVVALVDELLKLAHLEAFREFFPYQLSGGMRRRVVFLSTVAAQPEILLLDEPFSSLDEPTRVAIHEDVLKIIRRMNMTVVLVTHDLAEAISLCDEVVVLSARPGHAVARREIPFGAQRSMLELRKTPEFLRLYAELWDDLSEQIAVSRERGDDMKLPAEASAR
jgi:NitT/TauT family transport system ATP-binding protein